MSKSRWQLLLDYTFIRNQMPINTPLSFRNKHMLGFLQLQHPTLLLDIGDLKAMDLKSSDVPISSLCYLSKLDSYHAHSGVGLRHILIANQTICVECGSPSKPSPGDSKPILIYVTLGTEPEQGTVMPSRCSSSQCRHRGRYGWDLIRIKPNNARKFQPLKNRHAMPYWQSSNQTAFLTSLITHLMLPQVLWNHAGCLNIANQGN